MWTKSSKIAPWGKQNKTNPQRPGTQVDVQTLVIWDCKWTILLTDDDLAKETGVLVRHESVLWAVCPFGKQSKADNLHWYNIPRLVALQRTLQTLINYLNPLWGRGVTGNSQEGRPVILARVDMHIRKHYRLQSPGSWVKYLWGKKQQRLNVYQPIWVINLYTTLFSWK